MDIVERLRSAAITTSGRMSANHRLVVSEALIDAATEIAQLRKDAERYRWLREEAFQATAARIVQMLPGHMDAEIDAAMQGANTEVKPSHEVASA